MVSYNQIEKVCMEGDDCSGCSFKMVTGGMRECRLIVHGSPKDYSLCPVVEYAQSDGFKEWWTDENGHFDEDDEYYASGEGWFRRTLNGLFKRLVGS